MSIEKAVADAFEQAVNKVVPELEVTGEYTIFKFGDLHLKTTRETHHVYLCGQFVTEIPKSCGEIGTRLGNVIKTARAKHTAAMTAKINEYVKGMK